MKLRVVICAFLLLGFVGVQSLKKENFQNLWAVISGYSFPATSVPTQPDNNKCPLQKKNKPLASATNTVEEQESFTCYLLYKPGKV